MIEITGLPRGVRGAATLRGPRGARRLTRSTRLRKAAVGAYTVTARPVSSRKARFFPTIARCAVANRCPTLRGGRASLRRGARLKLYVRYDVMVLNTTKVLKPGTVRRIKGGLRRDGSMAFRGRAPLGFARGSVVVAAPSASMRYGLLRSVSRVSRHARETVVSTTPATLIDAIPRGAFTIRSKSASRARAAAEPETDFLLSLGAVECNVLGLGSLSSRIRIPPPEFTISSSWGDGPPAVSISGTFTQTASASLSWDNDVECELSTEVPKSPNPGKLGPTFKVFLGGVPIWMTPELVGTLGVSGKLTGPAALSATGKLSVTGGVTYDDGFRSTLSATGSVDGSASSPPRSGTLEASIGLKLYFDFDNLRLAACYFLEDCDKTPGTPYIEIADHPTVTVQRASDPWWRFDGVAHVIAGLDFPLIGLDVSKDYAFARRPLLAPPGKPASVTATPGNRSATVSWQAPPVNPATGELGPCTCLPVSGYTVLVDGRPVGSTTGATSATLTDLVNGDPAQVTVVSNSALGLSSQPSAPVTVTPAHGHPAVAASATGAGWQSSCAAVQSGSVYCWGINQWGQLGIGSGIGPETCGSDPCSTTPVQVSGLTGAVAVSAGRYQNCAVLATGAVECWGLTFSGPRAETCKQGPCDTTPVPVPGLTDAIAVTDQTTAACALLRSGKVGCWGDNSQGQLGNGVNAEAVNDPNRCSDTPTPIGYPCFSKKALPVSGISDAVDVSGGEDHACAVLTSGGVRCWGAAYSGQLGDGSFHTRECGPLTSCSTTPVQVSGLGNAIAVGAGQYFTCALLADGHVACWGENVFGQLGNGTSTGPVNCSSIGTFYPCSTTPVPVSGITDAVAIDAGATHTCVVLRDGKVACWGLSDYGRLGDGSFHGPEICHYNNTPSEYGCSTVPVAVKGITDAVAITAGDKHTCALLADGGIECWGAGASGQLGDGRMLDAGLPVETRIP